jgi:hypothetical protein
LRVLSILATSPLTQGSAAAVALCATGAFLAIDFVDVRRGRGVLVGAILLVVLAAMMFQPFEPARMGDYADFVKSKQNFLLYFAGPVQFQYHLGAVLVHGFYVAWGRTAHSPVLALDTFIRLASVIFVAGLAWLAAFRHFSAPVLRYLAIVFAAPMTLLVFGYHEFGWAPVSFFVWGIPLALIGLEDDRGGLVVAAAAALGVGAAFHGFGLVAIVFLLIVTVVHEWGDARKAATRVAQVVGAASFGWLVWLPIYIVGFKWTVSPSDAAVRPMRPLFHTFRFVSAHRYDYAVFSHTGLRDIFFEFVIMGVFASVVLYWLARTRLWWSVLVGTIAMAVVVVFYWPEQGLGNDTDGLAVFFPALFGVGWLTSRSRRLSLALVIALAVAQPVLLYVVHGLRFVHNQDF